MSKCRDLLFALRVVLIAASVLAGQTSSAEEAKAAGQAAVAKEASAEERRGYGIGRIAAPEEIAGWDIDVRPDGEGLPDGRGSVKDGEPLYVAKCAGCHGEFGESTGRWPMIAGGQGSLTSDIPVKTVGSYFPYLSSLFDYLRHAKPFGAPQSLGAGELYAIAAYVLYLNDVVDENFVLTKETFRAVKLPNESGFYDDDREATERAFWNPTPCMTNCKGEVKILNRADAIDVTPEDRRRPKAD